MMGLIGKKLGMTRFFDDRGNSIPVTLIEAGPCTITQIKTKSRDGYSAIQLGYRRKREDRTKKAQMGLFKKLSISPLKLLTEFRVDEDSLNNDDGVLKEGSELNVSQFKEGESVNITGTSKGKGFAGVVKRHNFKGGPKTRGQSDRHRAPGSIGASSYPSRVFKGMRMAGRLGGKKETVRKIRILKIDAENNLLVVRGSVPGPNNSTLRIWK